LSIDSPDLIFGLKELTQSDSRKLRCPSENDLQRCSHVFGSFLEWQKGKFNLAYMDTLAPSSNVLRLFTVDGELKLSAQKGTYPLSNAAERQASLGEGERLS
jgi:hypothetical protein